MKIFNKIPIPSIYADMAPSGYWAGLKTISIKQTEKALLITRMSHYVTIEKIRITPFKSGYVGKIKYEKNYTPTCYFTEYYDSEGNKVDRKALMNTHIN